jgi:hypothetical protein
MTSAEKQTKQRMAVLQGTLDMLILRTLLYGPSHGHQIGKHIQKTTNEFLQMQHGSLYPAPPAGAERLDRFQIGDRSGPQSGIQVLPADGKGQETAFGRRVAMEADDGSRLPRDVAHR